MMVIVEIATISFISNKTDAPSFIMQEYQKFLYGPLTEILLR